MILMSVDLPAPLSPSRHSTSPPRTSSVMSWSTSLVPKDLLIWVSLSSGALMIKVWLRGQIE